MSKVKFDEWLYCNPNCEEAFSMVTSDLLESEQFQSLGHAARMFYIMLATHKRTSIQKRCLYETLKQYHKLQGDNLSDEDIMHEAGTAKRQRYNSPYFVIPEAHLKYYGYRASYASKLKKELIDKGFIEEVFFSKYSGGYSHYNSKTPTIYKFVNRWKR